MSSLPRGVVTAARTLSALVPFAPEYRVFISFSMVEFVSKVLAFYARERAVLGVW
jgi:hypothetical protein